MFFGRKKKQNEDSMSVSSYNSYEDAPEEFSVEKLSDLELDALCVKHLADMNIKKDIADATLKSHDRNWKITLCQKQRSRTDKPAKEDSPQHYCSKMKEALNTRDEEQKLLLNSLKVTLSTMHIAWIEEFHRNKGFQMLLEIMDRLIQRAESLRLGDARTPEGENNLVECINHCTACVRAIMNTLPGVRFLLQKNSGLCANLIDTLYTLNKLSSAKYEPATIVILGLLAAVSFLGRDQPDDFEITGSALFVRDLALIAHKRGSVGRFSCILDCFKYSNTDIMYKALLVINTLLSIIDDEEWQVRMIWRYEMMLAGLKTAIPAIKTEASRNDNIRRAYASFEEEKKADYEEFFDRFAKLDCDELQNMKPNDCQALPPSSPTSLESKIDMMPPIVPPPNAPPPPPPMLLKSSTTKNPPTAPPPPPPMLLKSGIGTNAPSAPPPPPPMLLKSKSCTNTPMAPPPPNLNMEIAAPDVPEFLKKKDTRSADVPMKKIPWNSEIIKPNNLNKDSLWAEIDESGVASDELCAMLKSKFASKAPATAAGVSISKSQAKIKQPLVIQDAKMLQSLGIFFGSAKISLKEWHRSLLQIDESVLTANSIGQLRQVLPPVETLKQLKECAVNEYQNMVPGEQFVATLASINGLPIRLESIHLKLNWADNISELKYSITTVAEACDEIRCSKGLANFISLVLAAGNYMGRNKMSKDTFAFELGALNKLVNTKDATNSDTLLHYLIGHLDKKWKGRYTRFAIDDFQQVLRATKTDLTEVSKAKGAMKLSLNKISAQLIKYCKQSEYDQFIEKIGPFVEQAQKELCVVDGMWDDMQSRWSALQRYLCFDAKKYPMERLFCDLSLFKNHYESAWRDLTKAKEKKSQSSGLIDKIEKMLDQGTYRPGGRVSKVPK